MFIAKASKKLPIIRKITGFENPEKASLGSFIPNSIDRIIPKIETTDKGAISETHRIRQNKRIERVKFAEKERAVSNIKKEMVGSVIDRSIYTSLLKAGVFFILYPDDDRLLYT